MQCCPMDTYSGRTRPGLHGDEAEVADCSCGDGCQCACLDCACPWPDDDEDDPYTEDDRDETSFHYMPWGEIR